MHVLYNEGCYVCIYVNFLAGFFFLLLNIVVFILFRLNCIRHFSYKTRSESV